MATQPNGQSGDHSPEAEKIEAVAESVVGEAESDLPAMTMREVAKLCGVSRQTVHAALNGKPGVSNSTRERILKLVKRHNYTPNRLAATLHQKRTNLVGVTILNIRNPFFADLVQGIHDVLRENNLHMMLFETETKDEEEEVAQTIMAYRSAGLILCPVQDEARTEHLRALARHGVPLVSVGPVRGMETNYVEVENVQAGHMAAKLLVQRGHRQICYLEGPNMIVSARERTMGFLSCLMENQIPFSPQCVVPAGHHTAGAMRSALEVLSRAPQERPTGIVCFNDLVAVGVYEAAQQLNLRIPEDISVIGCDDIEVARLLGPPLTTIRLPVREMGMHAAEMLVAEVSHPRERGYLVKRFAPSLVERASVKSL